MGMEKFRIPFVHHLTPTQYNLNAEMLHSFVALESNVILVKELSRQVKCVSRSSNIFISWSFAGVLSRGLLHMALPRLTEHSEHKEPVVNQKCPSPPDQDGVIRPFVSVLGERWWWQVAVLFELSFLPACYGVNLSPSLLPVSSNLSWAENEKCQACSNCV